MVSTPGSTDWVSTSFGNVTDNATQASDDVTIALTPPRLAIALLILIIIFWLRKRTRRG